MNVTECHKDSNGLADFGELLTVHLLPLLFGARLAGFGHSERAHLAPSVAYHGRYRLRISPQPHCRSFFTIERKVSFSEEERSFVEQVVKALHEARCPQPGPALMTYAIERAIAHCVGPVCAPTLCDMFQVYKEWTEPGNWSGIHNSGIYFSRSKGTGGNFFALRNESCLQSMGASPDILLAIGRGGDILRVEKIPPPPSDHKRFQDLAAPIAHADIALWTSSRKAALRLCPDGALLVFFAKRLLFMHRESHWRSFPHTLAGIGELLPADCPSCLPPGLRQAMYLTCLDLSFAGQKACIGILPAGPDATARLEKLCGNALFTAKNLSGGIKLMADLVGNKKFQDLPRSFRMEMASMDGPLILDEQGKILSAGAGLSFRQGQGAFSDREAAQSFAEYGLGVSINKQGGVEVFGARYARANAECGGV